MAIRSLPLLLVSACSSLAGDHYQGEPLATMVGEVHSDLHATQPKVAAALIWLTSATADDWVEPWNRPDPDNQGFDLFSLSGVRAATLLELDNTFPQDFTFSLYSPPPDAVLGRDIAGCEDYPACQHEIEIHYAEGRVVAVDTDRIVDNGDGTVDVHDALIGSSDQVWTDPTAMPFPQQTRQYTLIYTSLDLAQNIFELFPIFAANDDPTLQYAAGYHLFEMTGQVTRKCELYHSLHDCQSDDVYPATWTLDQKRTYCTANYPMFLHGHEVDLSTPLVMTVQDAPLASPARRDGGFYPDGTVTQECIP